jgi:LAO/AO transport system kinase
MKENCEEFFFLSRCMGTRGGHGGLSRNTQDVGMMLDGAGYDLVILETAGVGQTELGILEVAHSILVVLVPESGDDIQMMKAGILEIADILVVNKCDRQGSDHIVKELRAMLELAGNNSWAIPVLKTVAEKAQGIEEVFATLEQHRAFLQQSGKIDSKRAHFAKTAILHIARDQAAQTANRLFETSHGKELLEQVSRRELDPFSAAAALFNQRSAR